jgi:mannose-6-phosphate isomerase-like protein (cupin superfamily)
MDSETITFGRQLVDGEPVGDGIALDVDSPTAELLEELTGPIISNPVTEEYFGVLVRPEAVDNEYGRILEFFPSGNSGPPEHYHPTYEEHFEVIEGEYVFVVDGERRTLTAGDEITVPPNTRHTYRNESSELATNIGEARPPAQIEEVVTTMFGLAHEGKVGENGEPTFLQLMTMVSELSDDTVFTSPPPLVQKALATVLAPVARLVGYKATYPKYLEDSFWETHVEQPDLE